MVLAVAPSPACEQTFFSLNTPEFQSKDAVSSLQRNYRCMSILFLTLWGSLSNVMEKSLQAFVTCSHETALYLMVIVRYCARLS